MYRKILIPLNGSPDAEKVLPHVLSLAQHSGAEIILFRVPVYAYAQESYHILAAAQGYGPIPLRADRETSLNESKRYLDKLRNDLIRLGYRVSVVVQEGEAVTRILEYARQADVDLIAMTRHTHTGWARLVFHSTADTILSQAAKPVLLIEADK